MILLGYFFPSGLCEIQELAINFLIGDCKDYKGKFKSIPVSTINKRKAKKKRQFQVTRVIKRNQLWLFHNLGGLRDIIAE